MYFFKLFCWCLLFMLKSMITRNGSKRRKSDDVRSQESTYRYHNVFNKWYHLGNCFNFEGTKPDFPWILFTGWWIVCVCESNSVPKRSKPLSWECSWCSCRGTQEAHRAVSNEALYGVFRISGLITLTYLHLWNCWQAVLIPCFPALGQRTTFPLTIPITLDQFSSRSIQFSFSIVF